MKIALHVRTKVGDGRVSWPADRPEVAVLEKPGGALTKKLDVGP